MSYFSHNYPLSFASSKNYYFDNFKSKSQSFCQSSVYILLSFFLSHCPSDKLSLSPTGAKDHFQWHQLAFMFQGANLVRLMLEIAQEIKSISALPVEREQVRALKQENHKSGLKG
jgi:hypothetical protein